MEFIQDDGGRMAAGFKGYTGDCVCRAIAIATGRPYLEIYNALAKGNAGERQSKRRRGATGRTAAHGINTTRKWFKDFMASLGFTWVPTMKIGSGCKVHLHDGELPMGRLVVAVSRHFTSVIDGVVHDAYDPQREVHSFTQFPGWREAELKPGQGRNENGIWWISRRCVYGYYILSK